MRAPLAFSTMCALAATSCSAPPAENPSFVRVVLDDAAPTVVTDAFVKIVDNQNNPIDTLCMKLAPVASTSPSFDLERAYGDDASREVGVYVTPEPSIAGDAAVEVGQTFGCPAQLPTAVGMVQLSVFSFCEGESRDLHFALGASCPSPCEPGSTCGAGLSTDGGPCGKMECCNTVVSAACALEPSN